LRLRVNEDDIGERLNLMNEAHEIYYKKKVI